MGAGGVQGTTSLFPSSYLSRVINSAIRKYTTNCPTLEIPESKLQHERLVKLCEMPTQKVALDNRRKSILNRRKKEKKKKKKIKHVVKTLKGFVTY